MATFEDLRQTLTALAKVNGVSMVDVLGLPAPLEMAIRKLLKEPMSVDRMAQEIQLPIDQTHQLLDILVDKGYLLAEEQTGVTGRIYKVYFARMRRHNLPDGLFDDK